MQCFKLYFKNLMCKYFNLLKLKLNILKFVKKIKIDVKLLENRLFGAQKAPK